MDERIEKNDRALVEKLQQGVASIKDQLSRVIVGQNDIIEQLLIALFSRGHALIVGVPGLAKTLLVSSLARIIDLDFKRIQFTPDLMPADITGTDVVEQDPATGRRSFRFVKGPIFAQIVLADEINRTPPKTQAALLQAMQEYKVTASGQTYPMHLPFFVLATQNPIEHEGTYPLPEAQLDRFFFQVNVGYPTLDEEKKIVAATTSAHRPVLEKALTSDDILQLQDIVRKVPAAEHVIDSAVRLVRASRPQDPSAPEAVRQFVHWGAGPRGAQALVIGAKAHAILAGRYAVSLEDVHAVALPALRHRILVNFQAEADGITTEEIIGRLMSGANEARSARVAP